VRSEFSLVNRGVAHLDGLKATIHCETANSTSASTAASNAPATMIADLFDNGVSILAGSAS